MATHVLGVKVAPFAKSPHDLPLGKEGPAARRSYLETLVHQEWESHSMGERNETYPLVRVNLNVSTSSRVENTIMAAKINRINNWTNVSRV